MVERRLEMENIISKELIPNNIRWYVVLSFSVERKIMNMMVADPITEIEPVTIGMIATTLNCSGVIDIFDVLTPGKLCKLSIVPSPRPIKLRTCLPLF